MSMPCNKAKANMVRRSMGCRFPNNYQCGPQGKKKVETCREAEAKQRQGGSYGSRDREPLSLQ